MAYPKRQNAKSKSKQSGFTLVELSIVLVIIGLIVASVLVGQDLVRQAELRSTITQYEQFSAAVRTFQAKYSALPGDMAGDTLYGWTGDGDGNGLLDAPVFTAVTDGLGGSSDNVFFWAHLGSTGAGLISGTWAGVAVTTGAGSNIATVLPAARAGNNWGVYQTGGINYYMIGASVPGTSGHFTTTNTLVPADALSIDAKIDDSRPGRGIIVARSAGANAPETAATLTAALANTAFCTAGANALNATYNTQRNAAQCTLRIRF
jgi:prepilin-type N-terminal cleavage/methylation domain-containing protein